MNNKEALSEYLSAKLSGEGLNGWRVSVQPLAASPTFLVVLSKGGFFEPTQQRHTEPIPYFDGPREIDAEKLFSKSWDEVQSLIVDELFDRDILGYNET